MTEQEKREKVIKKIEEAIQDFTRYSGDEYGREYDYARVEVDVLEDALALLKAQEPKPPIIKENSYGWKFYYCPSCQKEFYQNNRFNFCEKCGQAVKWG